MMSYSLIHTGFDARIFQPLPKIFGKAKLLRELRIAKRQRCVARGADLREVIGCRDFAGPASDTIGGPRSGL